MKVQRLEVNEQNDGELDYPSDCGGCGSQYLTLQVKNYKMNDGRVGLSVIACCPLCAWHDHIYDRFID